MRKKGFLIVAAVILLFIALCNAVHAQGGAATLGCCIGPDNCQTTPTGNCAAGQTARTSSCTQISDCNIGCCCKPSDPAVNGIVTIKKHCFDVMGQFYELSTYLPQTATYMPACRVICLGAEVSCSQGQTIKCSDGATVLATCTAEGKYTPMLGAVCPSVSPGTIDTDKDGVPDSEEDCPREPMLTTPEGTTEANCNDNIDNDCDVVKDCEDTDCCADPDCSGSAVCMAVTCGNGNPDPGEECDDGNRQSNDGCSASCRREYCGDRIVQIGLGEECDDGNNIDNDGCASLCKLEGVSAPTGATQCDDGMDNDGNVCADFPFDTGCDSEADNDESGGTCTKCGDGTQQTPNSERLNEDCDSSSAQCGPGGFCNENCACGYQCMDQPGNAESFQATPVKGQFAIELRWEVHPAASCSLEKVQIKKCSISTDQGVACNPKDIIAEVTFPDVFYYYTDEKVDARTVYCYKVESYYDSGSVAESEVKCIETGDYECLTTLGEFCRDNSRYKCDTDNFIIEPAIENCSIKAARPTDYFCSGPDLTGATRCVYQSECQSCNDIFGLFGVIGEAKYYETGWDATHVIQCLYIPTCYNDTTNTAVNKYKECSKVRTCYDYGSKAACEENKCNFGGCEWKDSEKAFSEFGVGVCRPAERSRYNCSLCDERYASNNYFYGDCDVEICKLYGDCYYAYGKCSSRDQSSCWAYATEDDCIGAGDNQKEVIVNTQWSINFTSKVDGTNKVIQNSSDYFSYGVCKWINYSGMFAEIPEKFCAKDADNNSIADCEYTDAPCQIDSTAPATYLKLKDHPYQGDKLLLSKEIDLDVSVEKGAITYFCIAHGDNFCYPNETSTCGIVKSFHGQTGDYTLYYFSEDKSHNLEEVKSVPVYIDTDYPDIGNSQSGFVAGGNGNDYSIKLASSEYLACSGHLERGNGVPTMPNDIIEFEIDNSFERNFYDLEDDKYYFVSRCSDKAGNLIENKTWFSIDTDKIHDPLPFGPIAKTSAAISVTTDENAECRYRRFEGVDPKFDEMYKFTQTGGVMHSSNLTGLAPNDYYEYVVKCKFNSGIEGNMNDRIRFAVDKMGPDVYPVSTFQAYRFDTSLVWGKDQHIFLQCDDNYFRDVKKVMNMDFGCKNLSYKTQIAGDYTNLPLDQNGLGETTIEIVGQGVHVIYYNAEDNAQLDSGGGNIADDVLVFTIDSQPPEFTIELYSYPMGSTSVPLDAISYGDYIVKVTSTKSLSDINMSLTVNGVSMRISKLYSEDFNKVHYFSMYVPYKEEGGLDEGKLENGTLYVTGLVTMPGSVCSLDEISDTDLVKTDGKEIKIDTSEPKIKIDPPINDYAKKGYPLTEKRGEIYYTNESQLFISGYTEGLTRPKEVMFFVMNGEDITTDMANPKKVYDFAENGEVASLLTQPMKVAYTHTGAGKAGSDLMYIFNPNYLLTEGKYIKIKNKERISYGHYKEYYKVMMVSYSRDLGNVGTLRIKPELEKDLAANDDVELYSGRYPNNWFGAFVDLEPGNNTIYVRPMSASGTMPFPTDQYVVFSDPNPPDVISQTPGKGTTNQLLTAISIVVREGSVESLLDESSVKLKLNGIDQKVNITGKKMGNYIYYYISYVPKDPLLDGEYDVVFEGNDYAGHKLHETPQATPSWVFIIDTKTPSTPKFNVIGGTYFNGIWYTNESPKFTLSFSDLDPVNITGVYRGQNVEGIRVLNEKSLAGFKLPATCLGTSKGSVLNFFECEFNPKLVPFISIQGDSMVIDDQFKLIVQAYKTLQSGEKSPKGVYELAPVVIDTLAPEIVYAQHKGRVRLDGKVNFTVMVNNEAHDLNATLLFMNTWYQLEQVRKIGNNIYQFLWNTPEDVGIDAPEINESMMLRIADYAGHADYYNDSVIMDMRVPDIEKVQIDVAPTVAFGQELVTRYTDIIINGTFVDSDIERMYIVPGNFMPSERDFENVINVPIDKKRKYFHVVMRINGTVNETTLNTLNVFMVDEAGYEVFKSLAVLADLQPPQVIESLIT